MTRGVVVTGPTASGKTHLAVSLALRFGGEIVSADSRQVYRGMDIGTGKDLCEYTVDGVSVRYHLIDIVEPMEEFHLFKFIELARNAMEDITCRGRLPIIVGGTPLYINALLDGYDQQGGAPDMDLRRELSSKDLHELIEILRREASDALFARTDLSQKRRVIRGIELARNGVSVAPVPVIDERLIIAPFYTRSEIHERVRKRLEERLDAGLLDEVARLHDGGVPWERMEWFGLEYRFASRHLRGELTREEMFEQLLAHIRQFCKHQDGWFRSFERSGKVIYWIPGGDLESAAALVEKWLAGEALPEPSIRMNDIRYGGVDTAK